MSTADDPSWPSEPPGEEPPPDEGFSPRRAPVQRPETLAGGIAVEDEAIALLQRELGARKL
ncbi:hypothetical protein STSO111631_23080 [Stackebrandtia soli]